MGRMGRRGEGICQTSVKLLPARLMRDSYYAVVTGAEFCDEQVCVCVCSSVVCLYRFVCERISATA